MASTNANSKLYFKNQSGSVKVYADVDPNPWPELREIQLGGIDKTTPATDSSSDILQGQQTIQDMASDITHASLDITFEAVYPSTYKTLDQLRDADAPILISPDDGATQEYLCAFKPGPDLGLKRRTGVDLVLAGTLQFQVLEQTIGTGGNFDPAAQPAPSVPFVYPFAPRNVVAIMSRTTSGEITVSWSPPPPSTLATTNYNVGIATSPGGPYTFVSLVGNVTSYNVTGLTTGVVYYVVVQAVDSGNNWSNNSIPYSIRTTVPIDEPPNPPTSVSASTGSPQGEINLTWTPPSPTSNPIANYNVGYSLVSGGPYTFVSLVGNVTSYTLTGLTANTLYYLVVQAVDSLNNVSTDSTQTSATSSGLAFHIYITDSNNNRIVRMDDMSGTNWTTYGTSGSGTGNFSSPHGIAIDATGRIYIVDTGNNRIVRMDDMSGTNWVAFGTSGSSTNEFNAPQSIALDSSGKIYVADENNNRIVRFNDMTGTGWVAFGTSGSSTNEFNAPRGIFVDSSGNIYVADTNNSRIARFTSMTGTGWTTFGTFGFGVNNFQSPKSVYVDGSGNIYVSDDPIFIARFVRFTNMSGAGWTTLGTYGSGTNQFEALNGIAIDGSGHIYIADAGNSRIDRFTNMSGAGWTTYGTSGSGTGNFNSPQGVAVS